MKRGKIIITGLWILLAVLSAGWTLFPPPADWVESWYSRGVFPRLAEVLVPAVDLVPFSMSAFLLAAIVVTLLLEIAGSWARSRKEKRPFRRTAAGWIRACTCVVVLAYAAFLILWGAGYRRVRLEVQLGLEARPGAESRPVKDSDILAWTRALAGLARRHAEAPRDEEKALESIRESMRALLERWQGFSPPLPRRVKKLPAGTLLAFGFSGLTSIILEPHVDAAEPGPALVAVAAHELAHCAGFCAEADADLVAAAAGLEALDPYARYSVSLHLFLHFASQLDPAERAKALGSLPDRAHRDIEAMDAAAARFRVASLANIQRRIYGAYLRSQGLQHGMKEYSFIVTLLVAAGRKGIVTLPRER